jgi:hypothetical protein
MSETYVDRCPGCGEPIKVTLSADIDCTLESGEVKKFSVWDILSGVLTVLMCVFMVFGMIYFVTVITGG